jgi:hypothetical protein
MSVAAHQQQSELAKQVTQFKADAEAEQLSHLDDIVYTHEDDGTTPPTNSEGSSLQHGQQQQPEQPNPVGQPPSAIRGLAPPGVANAETSAAPSSSSASQRSQEPGTGHPEGAHSQEDMTVAMAKASIRE